MEPKSQSSRRALHPPFGFLRSLSPTRHFHSSSASSSSSSAVNFAVPKSLSPTRTNHSVSSSVSLALGRSVSPNTKLQVRSAGSPPKGGVQGKAIPSPSGSAKTRKTCMCSPTTHPVKCKKIRHGKFPGKDWQRRRRMGEKSPNSSYTPFQPPHAKKNVFPATAKQAPPYVQG